MTFGESVRAARVSRGWSRARLIIAIRVRFKDPTLTISEETVRDIEEGVALTPRETTISLLCAVLTELPNSRTPINPAKPQSVIRESVAI